jgi:hypothetical protein
MRWSVGKYLLRRVICLRNEVLKKKVNLVVVVLLVFQVGSCVAFLEDFVVIRSEMILTELRTQRTIHALLQFILQHQVSNHERPFSLISVLLCKLEERDRRVISIGLITLKIGERDTR